LTGSAPLQQLRIEQALRYRFLEQPENLFGDVESSRQQLRRPFQYSHSASESTHCLSQFQSNEASAEHDQVIRYTVLQRFDVGQRSGALRPGISGMAALVQRSGIPDS